jgi:hypothetical protein
MAVIERDEQAYFRLRFSSFRGTAVAELLLMALKVYRDERH